MERLLITREAAVMGNTRVPFEPDTIYHIYNHGNGDDLIFRESENYRFFLEKFRKYISPVAKIYAYCLMPNHFHFLLRMRSEEELISYFSELYSGYKNRSAMSQKDIADLVSKQFKNLLISYSKSFNKIYDRRGSLFLDNLKRIPVNNDDYFTNMIRYIHFNPILHGFKEAPSKWKFSSYHAFCSDKTTLICRKEVFNWFGGKNEFFKFHRLIQQDEFNKISHLTLES